MEPIRNTIEPSPVELKKEDFVSDQTVKWCPGCGSHIILSAVENVFPRIGYKKENFVIVSGIGCSSRFPYYVNTYGFHGIHGRAHAIATGVKLANPGLSVWVSTGDGDSLAIGGNHFIHVIRRNVDLNILLFNNQIYGLTKGQFSPTTPRGTVTKTSPEGTIEDSFNVGQLVLGAQGTFFARVVDNLPQLMSDVLYLAAKHDGTSVVEILQHCVIFNDKAYEHLTNKDTRDDNLLILTPDEPMIFGKNRDKGLAWKEGKLSVIQLGKDGSLDDVMVHQPYEDNFYLHMMLCQMMPPQFPLAVGVIRMVKKPTFDDLLIEQINHAKKTSNIRCVDDLLNSGSVFEIS
ncbi:MAG: 2-oxoacid:ferredoxin oxidoreductase subunit beta [Bacteroidales bacterium]